MSNDNAKKIETYKALIATTNTLINKANRALDTNKNYKKKKLSEKEKLIKENKSPSEIDKQIARSEGIQTELNSVLNEFNNDLIIATAELKKLQTQKIPAKPKIESSFTNVADIPTVTAVAVPEAYSAPEGASSTTLTGPTGAINNHLLVLTMDIDSADKIDNTTIKYYKVDSSKKKSITDAITSSGASPSPLNLSTKGGKNRTKKSY